MVTATDPAHGTVVVAGDALSVTYQPDTDFHGIDTFDYTITDGDTTDVGTVIVDVNSPPVAVDDPGLTCQPRQLRWGIPIRRGLASTRIRRRTTTSSWFATCALLHNDTDADGER